MNDNYTPEVQDQLNRIFISSFLKLSIAETMEECEVISAEGQSQVEALIGKKV